MSDSNETREEYIHRQEAEGKVVRYPEPNELFIDIDTEAQFEAFKKSWVIYERELGVIMWPGPYEYRDGPSASGLPHRHIVVKLPSYVELTAEQRILHQAMLGSDPARELLSFVRMTNRDTCPTLFVETPK